MLTPGGIFSFAILCGYLLPCETASDNLNAPKSR